MTHYQHIKPQRNIDHKVFPVTKSRVLKSGKKKVFFLLPLSCNVCSNRIKEVPDNEGPESLKSFFVF